MSELLPFKKSDSGSLFASAQSAGATGAGIAAVVGGSAIVAGVVVVGAGAAAAVILL